MKCGVTTYQARRGAGRSVATPAGGGDPTAVPPAARWGYSLVIDMLQCAASVKGCCSNCCSSPDIGLAPLRDPPQEQRRSGQCGDEPEYIRSRVSGAAEREGRTSGDPGQFYCPNPDPLIYNGYREDECSRVSDDENDFTNYKMQITYTVYRGLNDFAPENVGLECGLYSSTRRKVKELHLF